MAVVTAVGAINTSETPIEQSRDVLDLLDDFGISFALFNLEVSERDRCLNCGAASELS